MNEEAQKFLDEYNALTKKHGLALRPKLNLSFDIIRLEQEKEAENQDTAKTEAQN